MQVDIEKDNSENSYKVLFNDKQIEQEKEYNLPIHWIIGRAYRERYYSVSKLLASMIKKYHKSGAILDVGCGDGKGINDIYHLLGNRYTYTGIDYSSRAILFAKALNYGLNIEFICCSANTIDNYLKNKYFDIIIYRDVLEHLCSTELEVSLKKAHTLLKENGIIVVTVPTINDPVLPKHYRHYTAELLEAQLSTSGFDVREVLGYVYQPRYLRWLLQRLSGSPLIWRLYRPFLRIVKPHNAKILIGIACKK